MATIPIEVIVQDKQVPVPETNTEETAAGTPDTGVGLVDNNTTNGMNGVFSSSASAIILPAILLTLALGTIIALFIRKQLRKGGSRISASKKEKLATITASAVLMITAAVLVGNLLIPATKAATDDTTSTEDGITFNEDKISITVTRDGGSAEASVESAATITSTSDFGYKVLLSMVEGAETANLYLDGDATSEYYITSTENTALTDNTWGYTLTESGEYSAIPLVDDAITVAQGDEPVEDELLSIYYGVRASKDLPAGTYSGGEVEYGLVAIEPTISDLTYMQDFAKLSESGKASVLRSMTEGEQYTLKDSRDTKDYFISRLKDGNVWMTQNLDLDIKSDGSITYDYTNTDLPANTAWEPSTATRGSDDTAWGGSNTTPESYDPGDLYWDGSINTDYSGTLVNATVTNPSETPGGAHYSIGNYYNWTAAVAMNDSSDYTTDLQNANQSICPAGWRLPTYEGDKSFDNLVSSQNLTAGPDGNMHTSPVYFVYGGTSWHGGDRDYFYVGANGQYLASAVNSASSPYGMYFYFSNYGGWTMRTQYSSFGRGGGNMVRCVAR